MNSTLPLRLVRGLSLVGVLVGTVFFAVSLSPSLLPRPFAVQGILSGVSFALGYGLGVAGLTLWNFLHLPVAGQRLAHMLALAGGVLCLVVALAFLWQASTWQNTIREMMGMEEAVGLRPAIIGPVAVRRVHCPAAARAPLSAPAPVPVATSRGIRAVARLVPGEHRRLGGRVLVRDRRRAVQLSAPNRRPVVSATGPADRRRPAAPVAPGANGQSRTPWSTGRAWVGRDAVSFPAGPMPKP